jgi:hypothetical protein
VRAQVQGAKVIVQLSPDETRKVTLPVGGPTSGGKGALSTVAVKVTKLPVVTRVGTTLVMVVVVMAELTEIDERDE